MRPNGIHYKKIKHYKINLEMFLKKVIMETLFIQMNKDFNGFMMRALEDGMEMIQ